MYLSNNYDVIRMSKFATFNTKEFNTLSGKNWKISSAL